LVLAGGEVALTMQDSHEDARGLSWYLPAGQSAQCEAAEKFEYFPKLQSLQDLSNVTPAPGH